MSQTAISYIQSEGKTLTLFVNVWCHCWIMEDILWTAHSSQTWSWSLKMLNLSQIHFHSSSGLQRVYIKVSDRAYYKKDNILT